MSERPDAIGNFRIEREIGRGGMGVVYLAIDPRLSRQVAIKALHPEVLTDPERRARMLREARVLAALNHPNIASLFGVEESEVSVYLVLEHVEGPTLAGLLARGRPAIGDALRWCAQIAAGVAAAHDSGVLHRDLKPANIKVRPDGIVKVLDFGLATAPPRSKDGAHSTAPTGTTVNFNTRPGGVLGTPGYMSPEQARGMELDKRADVFAFGCVLFECLTGRPAFAGDNAADLLAAVIRDEPAWDALPPDVSPPVRALLERCLAKDRDQRSRDLGDAALSLRLAADRPAESRSATAAPAQGVPGAPCVLPRELTSFVGRESEIAQVRDLLASAPVLTLTGAGGCGKTRLAIRAAAGVRGEYPAGTWFVDLSTLDDAAAVAGAAARTLNIPAAENADRAPAARIALHLAEKVALLVLDNAEHVLPAVRELVGAIVETCPSARVMVTSREALGLPYEQTYRVPSLAVPRAGAPAEEAAQSESGRLFIERARLADPSFRIGPGDGAALADLCARLDGIALAIELAAARTATMSLRDIDARLGEALRVLGPPTGGPGTRHATIRAAIEWSVRLLAPEESSVLEQLAVFAGGWNLAAAGAVCRIEHPGHTPDAVLGRLVSRSLVQFHAATGRYRFLETVRQFAAERLDARADASQVRERHAEFCLAQAERSAEATPGSSSPAMALIDDDVENIRAALRFLAGSPPPDDRFDRLAFAMHKWWYVHGEFEEGRRALGEALARRAGSEERFDGRLLAASGNLEWGAGRFSDARSSYERSLAVWERLGEHTQAAAMHSNIAIVCHRLGDIESGLREHERALAAYERAGDTRGLAFAKVNASGLLLEAGRLDDAEQVLKEALPVLQELKDQYRIGAALFNLGQVAHARGDYAAALSRYGETLECRNAISDRAGIVRTLHEIGLCKVESGAVREGVALMAHAVAAPLSISVSIDRQNAKKGLLALERAKGLLGDEEYQSVWKRGRDAQNWIDLMQQ
ncbi:MAG: protein kinase [Phycisphaeraceae bacterium]|nr:protein kinase [Phycisphaeraceae bacterium]